jgi:hypothetical protein
LISVWREINEVLIQEASADPWVEIQSGATLYCRLVSTSGFFTHGPMLAMYMDDSGKALTVRSTGAGLKTNNGGEIGDN